MSWLSTALGDFEAFLNGPNVSPATKAATAPVVQNLQAAGVAATAALPALAADAIDMGLSMIPGNGPFAGMEAEFLQAMAAEIATRLVAPAPAPAPAAPLAPPAPALARQD